MADIDIVDLLKKEGYVVVEGAEETRKLIDYVGKKKNGTKVS